MQKNILKILILSSMANNLFAGEVSKIMKRNTDKFEVGDKIEFLQDGPTLLSDINGYINNENYRACALHVKDFKPDHDNPSPQPVRILNKLNDKENRSFIVESATIDATSGGAQDPKTLKTPYNFIVKYKIRDSGESFDEIICRLDGPLVELTEEELTAEKAKVEKYLDKVSLVKEIFKKQSISIYKEIPVIPEVPKKAKIEEPKHKKPAPKKRIDL